MTLSIILKSLIKEHHLSESELARRTGIGQPVIHRMASGETDNPKVATLSPIANYFCLSISQLIGDEPLPKGRPLGAYNPNIQTWSKIPLLSWDTIPTWLTSPSQFSSTTRISTDAEVSELAYALTVKDSTMYPRFPEDTILIIEPSLEATDKDFVIAHVANQKAATFKQLLIDGNDSYLKPLNSDFNTVLIDKDTRFLGVMVQARMDFKKYSNPKKKKASVPKPVSKLESETA